ALFSVGGEEASMVTRDEGGLIRVWRLRQLTCLRILPGHMDIGFAVSGDGDVRRVTRIDALADLPLLLTDTGTVPDPSRPAFRPQTDLAVAHGDTGMRVYHIPSCRRLSILLGKNRNKEQYIFSEDGGFAVSGGFDEPLGLDDNEPSGPGGRKIVHFW